MAQRVGNDPVQQPGESRARSHRRWMKKRRRVREREREWCDTGGNTRKRKIKCERDRERGGGGKVENRIIVQRRPRCRLGADEKEEMKWTVRLTGIYILSCAICVSELCRVTVRRIRSGKSVIITRATLTEASSSL